QSSSANPNTQGTADGKSDHTKFTAYHQGNRSHHRGAGRVRHEFVPKNPTGIPRASLIHIPRHIHGAFRDPSGASVVPRQMAQLIIENSEKKADTSAQLTQQFLERDAFPSGPSSSMLPTKSAEEEASPPNDLLCPICKQIYTDAVITPCCHNSFCDHYVLLLFEGIRTALIESEEHECPHCHRQHVPIGQINPNLFLRKHINNWLEEQQRKSSCPYKSTVNYSSPSIIDKDLDPSAIQSSTNQSSNDVETNDEDDDDEDDTTKTSLQIKPQPTVKTAPIVIRMQPLRRDQSPPIASTKQTDTTLEDGKKSVDTDQPTPSQKDVNYQSLTENPDIGEEISNTETDTNTSEDVKSDGQSPSSQVASTDTIPSIPLTTTTIPTAASVTPQYYPTLPHDQHLHHNIVYPPASSPNFYPIHHNIYPPFVHPPYPGVHPSLISPSMVPPGGYHPYPLQPIYPPTHPFNGSHLQHNPINGYHVTHYETANVSSLHHPGTTYAATSTLIAHHHQQQPPQQHHEPTGQITPKPIELTLSKDEFYTRQRRVQRNKRSNSRHRSPSSCSSYTSSDSRDSSFARQRRRRSPHSRNRRYEDSRKPSPIRGAHREKRRPPPSPKIRQQSPSRDDRRPSKSRKSPPRSYHSTREKRRSPRPPPTVFQSTQRTFVYLDESSTSKQHSDRHRDHHRRKTRSKSPPSSVIVSSETRPKTLASRVEPVINEKRSSSILSNSSNKIHSSDANSNNENKRKKHHHHSTKKYQRHRRSTSEDNRTNPKAILNETVT
ncbi:unnamed protein product, partial [Adineta ricciae]